MTASSTSSKLNEALQSADAGVLLAILVQLTGDVSLLEKYESAIEHVPDLPERRGVTSRENHEQIVNLLLSHLENNEINPHGRSEIVSAEAWEHDVAQRLFSLGLGDDVGDEYVDLLFEQGGFQDPQPVGPRTKEIPADKKVAIIGAGLGGIITALAAKRAGINFELFDRNSDIGGTWLIQNYPGVGVDTPSQYYSISTHLNPFWTSYYPKGGEYQEYLRNVVDQEGLKKHITFEAEVVSLKWKTDATLWEISYLHNGSMKTTTANYIVTAAGYLNRPKFPSWEGMEKFKGESIHAAEWPEQIDLKNKRIAVVGTGCTAVQVVDALVDDVESMNIFQRQPHWVAPRKRASDDVPDGDLTLLKELPLYTQWRRIKSFWGSADNGFPVVMVDPEWAANHVSISKANDMLMQAALEYIDTSFGADSELAKKMTPDFAPFGKRIIRDPGGYFEALKRDHVSITNDAPQRVVEEGIIDADGNLVKLDSIIYCTGYYLDYLSNVEITGNDGKKLADVWGDSPMAYRGGLVPDFPNLFITSGPNQNPSHGAGNNFALEVIAHYFTEAIQMVEEKEADFIEVLPESFEEYNDKIDSDMNSTVWRNTDNAHTYYRNASGRVVLASPWKLVDVWQGTRLPDESHLRFGSASKEEVLKS